MTEAPDLRGVSPERAVGLDEIVGRAHQAADECRDLDQSAVDAIVRAMVVAGIEAATELAELAMEET
jgi:acetaldehyde dehydrogenase/alcohol dehydrogenase